MDDIGWCDRRFEWVCQNNRWPQELQGSTQPEMDHPGMNDIRTYLFISVAHPEHRPTLSDIYGLSYIQNHNMVFMIYIYIYIISSIKQYNTKPSKAMFSQSGRKPHWFCLSLAEMFLNHPQETEKKETQPGPKPQLHASATNWDGSKPGTQKLQVPGVVSNHICLFGVIETNPFECAKRSNRQERAQFFCQKNSIPIGPMESPQLPRDSQK